MSLKQVMDPQERMAELLFGLIMVLTCTGSLSVATAGDAQVHTMLIGALGSNLAWGLVDAIFFLMGSLAGKGRDLAIYKAVRKATDLSKARRAIADKLPRPVAAVLEPTELEAIRRRLIELPEPPKVARLELADLQGALGVFLIVFLSTFPVVMPFIFMRDVSRALRVSNGIAITTLFIAGAAYGRSLGRSPWGFGVWMVVFGSVLVALIMGLGG